MTQHATSPSHCLVLLAAFLLGCSASAPGPDAAPRDSEIDQRPAGPWVETLIGDDCQQLTPGSAWVARSEAAVGAVGDVAVGADGTVYIVADGLWEVRGDQARRRVSRGESDGNIGAAGVGIAGTAVAVAASGDVYVAEHDRLRLVSTETVTTVAGKKGETGHTDGLAAVARFDRIRDIVIQNGAVVIAEALHLRHFDGSRVTTIAGNGEYPTKTELLKDGPALQTRLQYGRALSLAPDGALWFHSYRRIWRLAEGRLTIEVGKNTDNKDLVTYRDGYADDARVGLEVYGSAHVGARFVFADLDALRELSGGIVSTLNSGNGVPPPIGYADGPLQSAQFGRLRGLAVDARGRLYVADVCRIRRVYLE